MIANRIVRASRASSLPKQLISENGAVKQIATKNHMMYFSCSPASLSVKSSLRLGSKRIHKHEIFSMIKRFSTSMQTIKTEKYKFDRNTSQKWKRVLLALP